MDSELMMARMLGLLGGGSPVDWAVLVLFIAFAVVYVIAPALGYRADRRGTIGGALFCLIGYAALVLFQMALQYLVILDRPGGGGGRGNEWTMHIFFLFSLLKTLVIVLSMLLFAIGVQALRLRQPDDDRDGPGRFREGSVRRGGREDDA